MMDFDSIAKPSEKTESSNFVINDSLIYKSQNNLLEYKKYTDEIEKLQRAVEYYRQVFNSLDSNGPFSE